MDTSPDRAFRNTRDTAGPATSSAMVPAPPGTGRSRRRRRPTGESPPLPRHLETTGVGWLVAAVGLVVVSLLVFTAGRYGHGVSLTALDDWVLNTPAALVLR